MSSSQSRDNVNYRPMWWIYGTGLVLLFTGFLILSQIDHLSLTASGTWLLFEAGMFLMGLSFIILTIPAALAAVRHPWGDAYRLAAERHYAHSRLVGLAQVWCGLVLSGIMAALIFVSTPAPSFLFTEDWWKGLLALGLALLAAFLVAFAPLLALYLFDRRR